MKKVLLGILVVLILLTLTLGVLFRSSKQNPLQQVIPTPTPIGAPGVRFGRIDYSHIFSEPSTAQQMQSLFASPSGSVTQNGITQVSYPTDVAQRPNVVYEKSNVAEYVMKQVTTDNSDLTDFLTAHPKSQSFQLYDTGSAGSGFSWYVFPQDGMAFLANKNVGGYAMQILYFPPSSKQNFISTIAPTFGLTTINPDDENTQESFTP